jgi:hypothetical protein
VFLTGVYIWILLSPAFTRYKIQPVTLEDPDGEDASKENSSRPGGLQY